MLHDLKTWKQFYKAVESGEKLFEIRKNDRNFQLHDILLLREYDQIREAFTGRSIKVRVTYILKGTPFLPPGYVCMSIKKCRQKKGGAI